MPGNPLSTSQPAPSRSPGLALKLILSLLVAGACVWLLHKGALPVIPPREAFRAVAWWAVPSYVGIWSTMHVARALRWRWLVAPIGPVARRELVPVAWIGFASVTLMPFRSGEALRPLLLAQRTGISGWAVTGTIAAERIIDGLIVSSMLLAGLTLAEMLDPLPERVGNLELPVSALPVTAITFLAVFVAAFAVLVVFWRAAHVGQAVLDRSIGKLSPRAAGWLGARVQRVAGGLAFLPSARHFAPYLGESLAFWGANVVATWLLATGCGFDVSLTQSAVIIGVLVLGIMVPNAPGFFGAFQISVYAALLLFFPHELVESRGAAFVFLLYVCQMAITFAGGGLGLLMLRGGRATARSA